MLPKKLLENFTLLKEYHQGGQSLTFLVSKGESKYIVKVPKAATLSRERKFRLEREIKALELMNGFGVPKLYDYSTEDEVYIVMDFIPGQTLNEYIDNKTLDLKSSVSLMISLCKIIGQAHKLGLFHRDIKPDNIIVEEGSNRPIIIDFGICWLSDDVSFKTKKGVELGNRFLRLPELAKGTDITVSSSDITFLVGILFYLATKEQPHILLNEDGLPPHKRLDVKESDVLSNRILKEIFDKGFSYEVSLRYSTAQELEEDLKRILLPLENEKTDSDAYKKLDELFSNDFYKKKETNIDILNNCHQVFLREFSKALHNSLIYGGSGPNFSESNRMIITTMYLVRRGTSEPKVEFHLYSQFNETFDTIKSSYGTEKFESHIGHTIRETTKMDSIYPEIARITSVKAMNELLSKIEALLQQSKPNRHI